MKTIKIGNISINDNNPPFIIAEAGVNHESQEEKAELMVKLAKKAGAHAIKFQTYEAETLVAADSPKYWKDDNPDESQLEFFKRSSKWRRDKAKYLADLCAKYDIMFLSTPFDIPSVDLLDDLGVPAFKIASADITSHSFIEYIAKKQKPIILSTGASNLQEILKAIDVIEKTGNHQIIILHCILSYPTEIGDANLNMIRGLKQLIDYPVGFSDHIAPTLGNLVPIVATALGANVIEKHFTFDKSLPGNDHFHSVDGPGLENLVKETVAAHTCLGDLNKHPIPPEFNSRINARRSIALREDKRAGETIEPLDIILLRPGSGISPIYEDIVVGFKLLKDKAKHKILYWSDIKSE